MINKVYLLWHTYNTNELLTVASLTKFDKKYIFKYEEDAIKAIKCGCMVPFTYTEEEICFDSLPLFFTQRMLSETMLNKLGINYNMNDEFSILTFNHGRRNNDNFYVVKEEFYNELKKESKVM